MADAMRAAEIAYLIYFAGDRKRLCSTIEEKLYPP
jgi:hypothetical protein